jgi:predicted aldo/keto reductase-like oxidoreductase
MLCSSGVETDRPSIGQGASAAAVLRHTKTNGARYLIRSSNAPPARPVPVAFARPPRRFALPGLPARRSRRIMDKEETMDRRDFLCQGTAASALLAASRELRADAKPIARRPLGKTGERLSIFGFGGTAVMSIEQSAANNLVAEAFDRGVNYYDVAPTYGNAQERLGPALEPYRKHCFLACKTNKRDKAGADAELAESLKLLRTDHLDLYQLHALTTTEDLEKAFGPNGAMETFVAARQAGKVRFLGFSAHSAETALAAMERFQFDTILFPTNFVLFSKAKFGPQVLERARARGMGHLAIKAMARGKYPADLPEDQRTPKCWYEPCTLPEEASLAWRWTLSLPVTAAVPPGNPAWFRLALDLAQSFQPITRQETARLMTFAAKADPLFQLGNNV